jgi:hypothetical protein
VLDLKLASAGKAAAGGGAAAHRDQYSIKAMSLSPSGTQIVVGGPHTLKLLKLSAGGGRAAWVNVSTNETSACPSVLSGLIEWRWVSGALAPAAGTQPRRLNNVAIMA